MLNLTESDIVDLLKYHKDNIFVIFNKLNIDVLNHIRKRHSYLFENIHIFKSLKMSTASQILNNIIYDKGTTNKINADYKKVFNFILRMPTNETSIDCAYQILTDESVVKSHQYIEMFSALLSKKDFFLSLISKYKDFYLVNTRYHITDVIVGIKNDINFFMPYLSIFKKHFDDDFLKKTIEPYMTKEIFLNIINQSGRFLISFVSKYDYSAEEKIKIILHFELYNLSTIFKSIAPTEYLEYKEKLDVNKLLNIKTNKKEKIEMINSIFNKNNIEIPSIEII